MKDDAVASVQSTSPLVAPQAYWCVHDTLQAVGFATVLYHCYVPSFGEWGFIGFGKISNLQRPMELPEGLRFLSAETLASLFSFPPDMQKPAPTNINRLNNQILVRLFEEEWNRESR
jgi:spermidine synthase